MISACSHAQLMGGTLSGHLTALCTNQHGAGSWLQMGWPQGLGQRNCALFEWITAPSGRSSPGSPTGGRGRTASRPNEEPPSLPKRPTLRKKYSSRSTVLSGANTRRVAWSSPRWRQKSHFNITRVFKLQLLLLAAPSQPTLHPALGLLKVSRLSSVLAVNWR